jgi:hypothetical protein
MKLSVAVVCLLILITGISADLSKLCDEGGDLYEDDNITIMNHQMIKLNMEQTN